MRSFRLSDAPSFVRWLNDPEVDRFLRAGAKKITLKEEIKWIKNLSKKIKTEKHFAIDTIQGNLVGSCGLSLSLKNKNAVLGIGIDDKRYWNQGLGTEATKMLIDYGFKKLKLHRIDLKVYSYNGRAIKVYKKLGFKFEGMQREEVFYKGKYYDLIQMGLLSREWKRK